MLTGKKMLELFHPPRFTKRVKFSVGIDIEFCYSSLMCIYIALEFLNVTIDTATEQGSARLQPMICRQNSFYQVDCECFRKSIMCTHGYRRFHTLLTLDWNQTSPLPWNGCRPDPQLERPLNWSYMKVTLTVNRRGTKGVARW
jgi:hypothetical protein